LLFLVVAFGISGYFRRRAARLGGRLDQSEGRPLLVLLRLLALLVILPVLGYMLNPSWVDWARVPLPEWARWMGVVLAATMLPAFYWLFSAIGVNISPMQTTRDDHQLITAGPYRWIRHPLYTFGLLFFLSISLLTGIWWLAAGLLIVFPLLAWRTLREEEHLLSKFGDNYRVYMQRTGRYLPHLFS
jgi:protein-S-isoprenylcysteine O-methyltransferase Ste14